MPTEADHTDDDDRKYLHTQGYWLLAMVLIVVV